MENDPVVIERTLQSSPERVWLAISNKEHMKNWYFDLADFKPEEGFKFEFLAGEKGKEYLHKCRILEVIPHKKISYSWRYEGYEGDSIVTFELFPEGNDQTRLRLTHEGLDSFPASNPDLAKENFHLGWAEIIGKSLPAYLKNN